MKWDSEKLENFGIEMGKLSQSKLLSSSQGKLVDEVGINELTNQIIFFSPIIIKKKKEKKD